MLRNKGLACVYFCTIFVLKVWVLEVWFLTSLCCHVSHCWVKYFPMSHYLFLSCFYCGLVIVLLHIYNYMYIHADRLVSGVHSEVARAVLRHHQWIFWSSLLLWPICSCRCIQTDKIYPPNVTFIGPTASASNCALICQSGKSVSPFILLRYHLVTSKIASITGRLTTN